MLIFPRNMEKMESMIKLLCTVPYSRDKKDMEKYQLLSKSTNKYTYWTLYFFKLFMCKLKYQKKYRIFEIERFASKIY